MNYLNRVIVDSKCPEFNSNAWFINYFIFSKYILDNYNVKGKEKEIYEFIKDFWKYINEHKKYSPKIADLQAIKFANNNKAGTNNSIALPDRKIGRKECLITPLQQQKWYSISIRIYDF